MLVWKLNLYITIFTKNIFRLLRYILRTLYHHDEPDGLYATVAPWRFRECTSEDIVLPISNISCQKKSDSMQKSHVTVRVVSRISRLPTVQALGWCIYRVWFRSPSRAYMSSEYKLLGNKELKKYSSMCLSKSVYIYAPQLHHCIGSVGSAMPGSWMHPEEVRAVICWWQMPHREVDSGFIYMSSSASARFLTLAQQTRRCVYMVCRVQLAKCSPPHVPIEASDGPLLAAVAQRFCKATI